MADKSSITWTDATWNYVTGCSVISPGCRHCYAMRMAGGWPAIARHESRAGLTAKIMGKHVWTGEVRENAQWLMQPIGWTKPRHIFVCAHGDLFHKNVPDRWIENAFAVMALAPQHQYQVLTKRSARMLAWATTSSMFEQREEDVQARALNIAERHDLFDRGAEDDFLRRWRWPLPNVWLGISVEDQARADERIPDLLATPAALRWISAEPLLGHVDIGSAVGWIGSEAAFDPMATKIDWLVAGGESGPDARPMHPDWTRSLRDQCQAAGVPFHFKQWGTWEPALDRERDDPDWRADYSRALADGRNTRWLNLAGGSGFHGERFHVMRRRSKKSASNRTLDGVTYDAFPEIRA